MSAPIQQILLADNGPGAHALAFLARTSGLDTTHTNAYIQLINGLDTYGLFSKFDALWVPATQDSTTATLNLISSSFTLTPTGSPTFTADRGYTGTSGSTTKYVNANFVPANDGVQSTLNSTHISAWSVTNISDNNSIMGCIATVASVDRFLAIKPKDLSGNNLSFVNTASAAVSVANSDGSGHYIANRSDSTTVTSYRNGSSIVSSGSNNSFSTILASLYLCGINNAGSPVGSAYQVAMASVGASLSSTDATNFYNLLRTYMTTVGVP